MVRPVGLNVRPLVQAMDVPEQPLKSSKPGLVKLEPMTFKLMAGLADCATNLYHTSYPMVPAQLLPPEEVDRATPPVVLEQEVADVSDIALLQSSLLGGSEMHILKLPFEEGMLLVPKTLT
jgi:hypothetical protein